MWQRAREEIRRGRENVGLTGTLLDELPSRPSEIRVVHIYINGSASIALYCRTRLRVADADWLRGDQNYYYQPSRASSGVSIPSPTLWRG